MTGPRPFLVLKSTAPAPKPGAPMPTSNSNAPGSAPLSLAITNLLSQLTEAYTAWEASNNNPAAPDPTLIDDPDTDDEVVKARRAGAGVNNARWAALLRHSAPHVANDIRTTVVAKSYELARSTGMAPADAVQITKGLVCDAALMHRRARASVRAPGRR